MVIRLRRLNGQLTPGLRPLQPQVDASATIATDTVGDEPSEVPLTAGVVCRIPPASGPDATATDVVDGDPSGTPPATVLVADAFDCGRVEVVPLPISPTLVPLLQPSEAPPAAVVVDDESPRSQVEDVPMPFVQARISLGSTRLLDLEALI